MSRPTFTVMCERRQCRRRACPGERRARRGLPSPLRRTLTARASFVEYCTPEALHVDYTNSAKGWMTTALFCTWLERLNKQGAAAVGQRLTTPHDRAAVARDATFPSSH